MDIRHLRYFIAVAQEFNFSRAAERLRIAQPPLSRQIRQLEEEMGVELIDRTTRPLTLTAAGRLLYEHALQVTTGFEQIKVMMRQQAQAQTRQFTIGFVGSVIFERLPQIIRRFRDAMGERVVLRLSEMSTYEQIAALREGRIDAGFGRLAIDAPDVRRVMLAEEPLVVAIPSGHPLSCSVEPVSLSELIEEVLILYPRPARPSYADQILSIFQDCGLMPDKTQEVQELQTALGMVAASAGICLVPASVQTVQRDEIVYRPVAEANVHSPIILSHRRDDMSPALGHLVAIATETFGAVAG